MRILWAGMCNILLAHAYFQVFPSTGVLTVSLTDTGYWVQTWSMSIVAGSSCVGDFTVIPNIYANGHIWEAQVTKEVFSLGTEPTTFTDAFTSLVSASVTPQVVTVVCPVTFYSTDRRL
jgi:hypothetical protein